MTDPLGQSQVLPYLKGLAAHGHSISLLSFEKPDRYDEMRHVIEREVHAAGIDWYPQKYTSKPPVVSAWLDYRKMVRKAVAEHKRTRFDIVHCRGYLPAMAGRVLKKRFGVKLLFDMRGFWADERVEGGIWPRTNPVYRFVYQYFKRREKELLISADEVISLTRAGKKIIQSWPLMEGRTDNISVIPCCADFKHFSPEQVQVSRALVLKQELGIDDSDFVLSYLGSIGSWYMLPEMLAFFKVLLEYKPNARMLFITRDSREQIQAEAQKQGIDPNRIICRGAPRSEVPILLSLSSLSVFFIKPVFSKQASSPTKLAEILGMGIPVMANAGVGDVDWLFDNHFPELLVKKLDDNHYREVLQHFFNRKTTPPEKLRSVAQRYFSLTDGIDRYHIIYQKL
ncbi:MAG: glycosyltransferase [Salinivirgaceae bacterium]